MLQNYERKTAEIREQFLALKKAEPERFRKRLTLSFSTWMFGGEPLEASLKRLKAAGLDYVELPGNHQTPDLGWKPAEVRKRLADYGMKVAGICGLYDPETDLASDSPYRRQRAIDYLRREIECAAEVGAEYIIVVPSAVGRPDPLDEGEYWRSVEAVRNVAQDFLAAGIKAAVEPIRSAEVSLIHTIEQAQQYIKDVDHPGISHLNGDIYHMLNEEEHVGAAILQAGAQLVNLHLADTNRGPLGRGMMDVDVVVMALYLLGCNSPGRFVTGEALGIGGNPYALMKAAKNTELFDQIVQQTIGCFREREEYVLSL